MAAVIINILLDYSLQLLYHYHHLKTEILFSSNPAYG